MKFIRAIAIACFALVAQFAYADTGPYYVSYPGYCNVKKVYQTPTNDIYGTEVGCSSIIGSPVVGSTTVDGRVAVASIVNGVPCMTVYWTDGTLVGGCSSGSSLQYTPRSTFTVRMSEGTTVRRQFNLSTEMPDTSASAKLPTTDF